MRTPSGHATFSVRHTLNGDEPTPPTDGLVGRPHWASCGVVPRTCTRYTRRLKSLRSVHAIGRAGTFMAAPQPGSLPLAGSRLPLTPERSRPPDGQVAR